ncbi:hypothetical protein ACLK1U_08045 [Escherichia coli]
MAIQFRYQIIPYAGGTHPVAKGAQLAPDEVDLSSFKLYGQAAFGNALSSWRAFPGRQISDRSTHDTGLGQYSKDNESLDNTDAVVWMTTGTTHVARAEEWPICRPNGYILCLNDGTSLTKRQR